MHVEPNSLTEVALSILIVIVFGLLAFSQLFKMQSHVAVTMVRHYYIPMYFSGLFLLQGFHRYFLAVIAFGMIGVTVMSFYMSGFFKKISLFPMFSRFAVYSVGLYPLLGLVGYYFISPWTQENIWIPGIMVFFYGIVCLTSYFQLLEKERR